MSVVAPAPSRAREDRDDQVCHILDWASRQYCTGVSRRGQVACAEYNGEEICPSCGNPTCPACATLAELDLS